jgi:galactokinase/mevalonate kinase-like predicted kinase
MSQLYLHPDMDYLPQHILDDVQWDKVNPAVIVTSPARVDFVGGWTDTPFYSFSYPSRVIHTAMLWQSKQRYAIKIHLRSQEKGFQYICNEQEEPTPKLVKMIFEALEIESPPLAICVDNEIPQGSGLGGSGILAFCIIAGLVAYYRGIDYFSCYQQLPMDIANLVLKVEQLEGTGGGSNDTIGALPEIHCTETQPGNPCVYRVETLPLSITQAVAERMIIVDTGTTRLSAPINSSIGERFAQADQAVINMLAGIYSKAGECWNLLCQRDYPEFWQTMAEAWRMVCEVEGGSSTLMVDQLRETLQSHGAHIKLVGAGGGGFGIVGFPEPGDRQAIAGAVIKALAEIDPGGSPRVFDTPNLCCPGLTVWQVERPRCRYTVSSQNVLEV